MSVHIRMTFEGLKALLKKEVSDLPEPAVAPIAAATFMCVPLPPAWSAAVTAMKALVKVTTHPHIGELAAAVERIRDEEFDRIVRSDGKGGYGAHLVWRGHRLDSDTRRRYLTFLGVEVLRRSGLPLEGQAAPTAFYVMEDVLDIVWPRPTSVGDDAIERTFYRGKKDFETLTFPSNRPNVTEPLRLISPDELANTVYLSYRPDDVVWIPDPDAPTRTRRSRAAAAKSPPLASLPATPSRPALGSMTGPGTLLGPTPEGAADPPQLLSAASDPDDHRS